MIFRMGDLCQLPSINWIRVNVSSVQLQAVGLPILLTFLPYAVSLVSKNLSMTYVWRETSQFEEHNIPFHRGLLMRIYMFGTNILALRAYVVVSFYYSYNHSTPISDLLGCSSPTLRCWDVINFTCIVTNIKLDFNCSQWVSCRSTKNQLRRFN